jgi:hypothetical protein
MLTRPLRPGEAAVFHVAWHFVVPRRPETKSMPMSDLMRASLTLRIGRDGRLYQIAQWYPRVNVYDDLKGWNTEPYPGGEFYLEYGDFTLAVTAPADYIIAATGTLDNPGEVLTATQRARLAQAARTDTVIHVITAEELANGSAHPKHNGMMTWKFHAKNVRDAVFAASPDYQWDATHWKGIMVHAYYRPAATHTWSTVADMAKVSVREYSERWSPYPYPQVSVAEGNTKGPISGGMEYPMISFDATFGSPSEVYHLITHEVGHNWFPMMVGSNERVHGWMDEGLDTFINTFSQARRFPEQLQDAQPEVARPASARLSPLERRQGDEYNQPAYLLQLLRRDILGPAVFDEAFRTYIRRWAFKHPSPADFFRTMNDVSGRNLDWFWREWFYTIPGFDQAIDSVMQTALGSKTQVVVVYGNRARGVLPLLVRFTFSDSTTQNVLYPADVWRANSTTYIGAYTFPRPVTRIEIDAGHHMIDADQSNNVWTAQKEVTPGTESK